MSNTAAAARPLDTRDQIALACLSAFLQREPVAALGDTARQHLARISYAWADTMLAHRDANPAGVCHD